MMGSTIYMARCAMDAKGSVTGQRLTDSAGLIWEAMGENHAEGNSTRRVLYFGLVGQESRVVELGKSLAECGPRADLSAYFDGSVD